MGEGYKIRDQFRPYHLTLTIVDWVNIFTEKIFVNILVDSLKFCQQNKGLVIYAFVIMPTHLHLMISSETGQLSDVIRDLKRHTSKKIIDLIKTVHSHRSEMLLEHFRRSALKNKRNNTFQVWVQDNHPVELFSNKFIWQRLNYIHNNPVEAGLVEKPEDYLYSSARNYAGLDSIIDVVSVSMELKTVS